MKIIFIIQLFLVTSIFGSELPQKNNQTIEARKEMTMLGSSLKQKLQMFYPDDKATGYKEGDLRGAFTLTKELP